ncbi:MAG: hypothetical protein P1U56_16800 [Saprospiraceae bacterium]|nr:hypothetical protein [Saprospiraceae bacterium]
MKNSIIQMTFFCFIAIVLSSNHCMSQDTACEFTVRFTDPHTGSDEHETAQVTIHHDEILCVVADVKNQANKSKALTLVITKPKHPNAFKVDGSYGTVWLKKNGKTVELKDVTVKKKQKKGNKIYVLLKFKKAK